MEENIYQAPESNLVSENQAKTFDDIMAVKSNHVLGRRWLATFIDYVVLALFLLIPAYVLGNDLYRETMLLWLSLLALYFPVMEGITGYSIGKFICRARVVDKNGKPPGIFKCIIRTVLRIFEVNPLLAGGVPAGLVVLFSKKGQRVGDMLANTYVASTSLVDKYNNQRQGDA